jgi:hypothetical protein
VKGTGVSPMRFATALFIITIAGCGASAPAPSAFPGTTPDRIARSVARWPAPFHPDRRKSWISPEIDREAATLLFVSDSGTADVYIYKLPTLKNVATITGFSQPQGECSDNKGDVWIADTNGATIYELSHHGQLNNELADASNPVACAWDPSTGNLAVMNLFGTGSTSGGVLIYPKGSQAPTLYQNPKQYYYNFGGYDSSGDLYFDGRDESGSFMLSELPKGANSAHTIKLQGTIYFPGMVEWNSAKHQLIVGDQSCGNAYASCVYAVTITKNGGTLGQRTNFQIQGDGPVCDLVQGVEYGGRIAGSNFEFCGSIPSGTYLWSYPSGGAPLAFNDNVDATPVGAAISK